MNSPLPTSLSPRRRAEESGGACHYRIHGSAPARWVSGAKGTLLAVAALVIAWQHTFAEMWLRWFPAWTLPDLSLTTRLLEGDSYYTHGPLVLLASLVIAVVIYKVTGVPVERSRGATALGWALLATSLIMHLLSVHARVTFVSGFSLIGVLLGLLLCWGGRPLLRAYLPAVATLVFMVPLPMVWIADLNLALKLRAGWAALWVTNELLRVPAVMDGSYLHLLPEAGGGLKTLVLGNVCGGVRSLISLMWFGSLFVLTSKVKGWWRYSFLVLSIPIALGCNVLRVTALTAVAHHLGLAAVDEAGWFHGFTGVLAFVVAIAMFFVLECVLVRVGRVRGRRRQVGPVTGRARSRPRCTNPAASRLPAVRPSTVVALALAALLSVWWADQTSAQQQGVGTAGAAPAALKLDGRTYRGHDLEVSPAMLAVLETRDCTHRLYRDPQTGQTVELFLVCSPRNRKATHPPEVCLEAAGENIVSKQLHHLDLNGVGPISMCELVAQQGERHRLHLYVYRAGNRYTTDFFAQQFTILWRSLTARDPSSALIRLTVPVSGVELNRARALALDSATRLMPILEERLP